MKHSIKNITVEETKKVKFKKWEGKSCIVYTRRCGNMLSFLIAYKKIFNALNYSTCRMFTFEDILTGVVYDLIIITSLSLCII